MRRRLSARDVEEIVRMFHAGVRSDEIGRIYRVTGRAVRYRLASRGLRYRRVASPRVQLAMEMRRGQLHQLRGRGLTVRQMAAQVRLRAAALRVWMSRRMPELYAQLRAEERAARRRYHR